MKLAFDLQTLHQDIDEFESGLRAIGETLAVHGRGEVIAGRRPKLAFERRNVRLGREGTAVPSGASIANFLRAKNADPFAFPDGERDAVLREMNAEIQDAIGDAFRSRRPQTERVRRAIIGASMDLAEMARQRIISGRLGNNSKAQKRRKSILVNMGRATRKYGVPPPYGIITGRFVESIRWRWRRGYRPGGIEAADSGDITATMTGSID